MDKNTKIHRLLPPYIRQLCFQFDAFIVGSFATYLINQKGKKPADIDIIIEPKHYAQFVLTLLDKQYELNSFGGFKITFDWNGVEYKADIWLSDLNTFLQTSLNHSTSKYLIRPKGKIILELK